jgi:hypothetical protein
MPLQDVSNDTSMMDWLRQSGHGHLLGERTQNATTTSTSSPLPALQSTLPFGLTTSSSNYPPQTTSSSNYPPPTTSSSNYPPPTTSSSNYPPQTTSISSPLGIFTGGFGGNAPTGDTLNRSASFPRTDFLQTSSFGGGGAGGAAASSISPPIIPPTSHFSAPSLDHLSSPVNFNASPTPFLTSNVNQQQLDIDIEVRYLL